MIKGGKRYGDDPHERAQPGIHGDYGAPDVRGARVPGGDARAGRGHRRAHRTGDQTQGNLFAPAHEAHPAQG
ncbi:hypothetical protein PITCH_A230055 [uncultured Desulfobacterium sp.]|uniref:Uncharacterized protein n=1 Tax=uncultured Desulfobacterium sp. TaxID=201089 RepID=A0A445MY66_9BACT|nr:hypothetical protein PITCH_A230055 [uncultured Desulfobacterium sp.]